VACADVSWPCDASVPVERFLDAYRAALVAEPSPAEPSVVARLRGRAPGSPEPWLDWVESLMQPLPAETSAQVNGHFRRFGRLMRNIRPDLAETTFDVVHLGSLRMGFGSAFERKLLFRVAGPTDAPEDDLVIEAREGTPPASDGCVWRPSYGESVVLMFSAVLGRRMPDIHCFVPLLPDAPRFWLQQWDRGYVELDLSDVRDQRELQEVAVDAARQLGGHLWRSYPAALLPYQLHAQRDAFDATRPRVASLARELALETLRAWEEFRGRHNPASVSGAGAGAHTSVGIGVPASPPVLAPLWPRSSQM
jgi:hypothetical protein